LLLFFKNSKFKKKIQIGTLETAKPPQAAKICVPKSTMVRPRSDAEEEEEDVSLEEADRSSSSSSLSSAEEDAGRNGGDGGEPAVGTRSHDAGVHVWKDDWRRVVGLRGSSVSHEKGKVEVTLLFRTLATLITFLFFFSLLVGVIVTYTVSEFSSDRDYLYRTFGVWNPCLLYDHFPSNVVVLPIVWLWLFLAAWHAIGLGVFASLLGDLTVSFGVFTAVAAHYVTLALFLNIFSTNLYEDDYHEHDEDLTEEDNAAVMLHTAWYGYFLFGFALFGVAGAHTVHRAVGRLPWSTIAAACSLGLLFFQAGYYLVLILHSDPNFEPETALQKAAVAIQSATYIRGYAWLIPLVTLFIPPREFGIRVSFRLRPQSFVYESAPQFHSVFSDLTPRRVLSVAFRLIAATIVGTYLATDPDTSDDGSSYALASGFRTKPYRYMFVPVWFTVIMLASIAVSAAVIQRVLRNKPFRVVLVFGVAVVVSLVGLMELVISQLSSIGWLFLFTAAMLFGWFAAMYWSPKQMTRLDMILFAVYLLIFLVFAICSTVTEGVAAVVFNCLFVAWLCVLEFFVTSRGEKQLQWRIQAVGALSALEWQTDAGDTDESNSSSDGDSDVESSES
jgi:hypothetical protein